MRFAFTQPHKILTTIILVSLICIPFFFLTTTTDAALNEQINYQGKLTNASNVAVANGTYNMRFWLLTSPSIATTSAVWTESLTGTNRVQVTNGLFSVMLGSTSPLTGVDFNQALYLGVEIGATGTPAWDGEMSPRKILGTVPSAFEAKNTQTLGGVASTSFLRSDQVDSASALLTFTGGIISNSSSTITSLTIVTATTTTFVINGEAFTDLTGSGLSNSSNALTCATSGSATFGCLLASDWSSFNSKVSSSSIDTSAELATLLTDETGTAGNLVFSTNPLLQGFRSNASSTIGDGTSTGGLTIFGNSTTTLNAYFAGDVGIGTSNPTSKLSVNGNVYASGTINIATNKAYQIGGANVLHMFEGPFLGISNIWVGDDPTSISTAAAHSNTSVGIEALDSLTGGYVNTALGWGALSANTGGYGNTAVGASAGLYLTTASSNSYFGVDAGIFLNGDDNAVFGLAAFSGGTGNAGFVASRNTVFGTRAGDNATTSANNNILLGYQAADNITSGASNIVIGYNVDLITPTSNNTLNIGNLIFGTGIDGTGTTLSSGNIGIGSTTPSRLLTVEVMGTS